MYCPNCHKEFDVDYWRCPECGEPLAEKKRAAEDGAQGLGIASMILGILALVSVWLIVPAGLFGLISIILGIIQLARHSRKGMAIAGIVMSVLAMLLLCLYIFFIGWIVDEMIESPGYYQYPEDFFRENIPGIQFELDQKEL